MTMKTNQEIVAHLVKKYEAFDFDGMRSVLAGDLVSHITNRDGNTDVVCGADSMIERQKALKTEGVDLKLSILQSVDVDDNQVLALVHVQVKTSETHFENFAAFLFTIKKAKIAKWWMVEAKPEESDRFWKTGKV